MLCLVSPVGITIDRELLNGRISLNFLRHNSFILHLFSHMKRAWLLLPQMVFPLFCIFVKAFVETYSSNTFNFGCPFCQNVKFQ